MLVLTRKVDQGVQIGPDTTVRVLEFDRSRIKFGVNALDGVPILCEDLPDSDDMSPRRPHEDPKGLLVFKREIGQGFSIGENIHVFPLRWDGAGRFKMGIDASRDVRVLRLELLDEGREDGEG